MALLACTGVAHGAGLPSVSIIIDDLGEQRDAGLRALRLPGTVAYSFLPHGPFTAQHAELAHRRGAEVLLHLPLEPRQGRMHPTAITARDHSHDIAARFQAALATVPHARGVNNHQGSRLTALRTPMDWLMGAMRDSGGLYFVDSFTSADSVALPAARAAGLPATRRDVFLDNDPSPQAVRAALHRLVLHAHRHGTALAIGHPYPSTLTVLEQELPRMAQRGVRVVAPSALIVLRDDTFRRPRLATRLKLSPALAAGAATTTAATATNP